ncbi:hypothetical protein D3C72_1930360 [compost metagenome]
MTQQVKLLNRGKQTSGNGVQYPILVDNPTANSYIVRLSLKNEHSSTVNLPLFLQSGVTSEYETVVTDNATLVQTVSLEVAETKIILDVPIPAFSRLYTYSQLIAYNAFGIEYSAE